MNLHVTSSWTSSETWPSQGVHPWPRVGGKAGARSQRRTGQNAGQSHRRRGIAARFQDRPPALMDINDISAMLPHRYPFLLVDRIMDMDDSSITGVKNVDDE